MIKPILTKYASVKLSLFLLLLMVIFNVVIMPYLAGDKQAIPLDLQFAYTPERAYELIHSYDEDTRHSYMIGEMTMDVAYPIVYTLFLSLTFVLLFPSREKIALIPYIIFIADMFENTGIITMLYHYPSELYTIAVITSVFSTIKWSVVLVCFVILIVGLIRAIIKKIKK